jgi:nucleoside-diphosphate-sugar epimerase
MRILILGGYGFVGNRLGRYFASLEGWSVEALGSVDCDLTARGSVDYIRSRVDANTCIVFCSTISRLREDSVSSFNRNVKMAETVAEALSACDFRSLAFCSSIDVYGRPPTEMPITERSKLNPAGYYGYSKLASEDILERELGFERGLAVLRLPGIYSLDDGDPSALGMIFRDLRAGMPVKLSGGGVQVRTYLAVTELARVMESVFRRRWSGRVNLCSSQSYSIRVSAEMMKEFLRSPSLITSGPTNNSEFNIMISGEFMRQEFSSVTLTPLNRYLEGLRL